ncbi:MAG TPA: SGNH/GDSL hydrolase family protein, partial [Opitutus sp.]|nr:SGNH/GDSL hydrolase family protein [Opitutus sp.]
SFLRFRLFWKPLMVAIAWGGLFATESGAAADPHILTSRDLVAICGDSITEHKIYSVMLESYLAMCLGPDAPSAAQFGWSGETAWGFEDRLVNDVLPFRPTVVTTCYGMNDAHYRIDSSARRTKFAEAQRGIIRRFKDAGVRWIVVGSPGVVDTETYRRSDPKVMNAVLADLAQVAREVAVSEGVGYADVQGEMQRVMAQAKERFGAAYPFAGKDGVHPGPNGHFVMAYAFLKALGCSGDIGTITVDLGDGSAFTDPAQMVVSIESGTITVESLRYPFCIPGGEDSDPANVRALVEFVPFHEQLNRYMLVVRNAPDERVRIGWGEHSREFSRQQLERGINLAAEFPDNPFNAPFAAVAEAIKRKQAEETVAVKVQLHSLIEWNRDFPEEKAATERLTGKLLRDWSALRDRTKAEVRPVRHEIRVESIAGFARKRPAPGAQVK